MVIFNGSTMTSTGLDTSDSGLCMVALTNSTTVTLSRGASHSDSVTGAATIIEFQSFAVASATQTGTISLNSVTSNTATISAVSANAFVLYLGETVTTASMLYSYVTASVVLTNSTTVTAQRGVSTTSGTTVRYMVVDLTSTVIASVTPVVFSYPIAYNSTPGVPILPTTLSNTVPLISTIFLDNGITSDSTSGAFDSTCMACYLYNTATLQIQVGNGEGASVQRKYYGTLVSFQPSVLKSNVQRGITTIAKNTTSNTSVITTVTTSKAFCNPNGWTLTAGLAGGNGNRTIVTNVLTNSTTVTLTRNTSDASAGVNGPFEVCEFR